MATKPFQDALDEIRANPQGREDTGYSFLKTGIIAGIVYVCWNALGCMKNGQCSYEFDFLNGLVVLSQIATIYFFKSLLFYGFKSIKHAVLGMFGNLSPALALEILFLFLVGWSFSQLMTNLVVKYTSLLSCLRTDVNECPGLVQSYGMLVEMICENPSYCYDFLINMTFPMYALIIYVIDQWFEYYLFGSPAGANTILANPITRGDVVAAVTEANRCTHNHLVYQFRGVACADCRRDINWNRLLR